MVMSSCSLEASSVATGGSFTGLTVVITGAVSVAPQESAATDGIGDGLRL
ncbi:hypothetical protein HQ563_12230 [bacterium]|nr:hypothetical protein [bacterium]